MLSPKQIGTICFAIFSFIFSAPLFATDIPSSASTADCKHTPLQVYSGQSNLEADWQPNTIQLHWYNGDTEIQNVPSASQSCVYDGTLTPPATIPTKTGYTFKGWRVRQCIIPSSLVNTDPIAYGYKGDSTGVFAPYEQNADTYGLEDNTWAATWDSGEVVYGRAKCSITNGTYATPGIPSDTKGLYCWCAATGYVSSGSGQCTVSNLKWLYRNQPDSNIDACLQRCVYFCASRVYLQLSFRSAIFNLQ